MAYIYDLDHCTTSRTRRGVGIYWDERVVHGRIQTLGKKAASEAARLYMLDEARKKNGSLRIRELSREQGKKLKAICVSSSNLQSSVFRNGHLFVSPILKMQVCYGRKRRGQGGDDGTIPRLVGLLRLKRWATQKSNISKTVRGLRRAPHQGWKMSVPDADGRQVHGAGPDGCRAAVTRGENAGATLANVRPRARACGSIDIFVVTASLPASSSEFRAPARTCGAPRC
ncbi:hypothetical protein ACLOJK_002009, partial [Asimina triloba]